MPRHSVNGNARLDATVAKDVATLAPTATRAETKRESGGDPPKDHRRSSLPIRPSHESQSAVADSVTTRTVLSTTCRNPPST